MCTDYYRLQVLLLINSGRFYWRLFRPLTQRGVSSGSSRISSGRHAWLCRSPDRPVLKGAEDGFECGCLPVVAVRGASAGDCALASFERLRRRRRRRRRVMMRDYGGDREHHPDDF